MDNIVGVDSSRLAAVETNVEHLSKDVGDIKTELRAINEINKGVGESLAKLTLLAEQTQKRDDLLLPRVEKLEKWQTKKDGIILVIIAVVGVFGDQITKALGL